MYSSPVSINCTVASRQQCFWGPDKLLQIELFHFTANIFTSSAGLVRASRIRNIPFRLQKEQNYGAEYVTQRSRDSTVCIAFVCGLQGQNVGVPANSGFFSSPRRLDRLWGRLHIQWISETLSPEMKRLGREADHSPPTSPEVKNA
jgi:hypothetical protein